MSNFFRETNPVVNLIKCIDAEITALTNTSKVGELKTIEEIIEKLKQTNEIEIRKLLVHHFLIQRYLRQLFEIN